MLAYVGETTYLCPRKFTIRELDQDQLNQKPIVIMGQTYSVILRLKVKDEQGAKDALRQKIAEGEQSRIAYGRGINYGLDREGVDLDNLDCLLRIFFAGWGLCWCRTADPSILSSSFDASYGWEGVMMDAFDILAPYLEELSNITIYPDTGKDLGVVVNGEAIWKI